MWRGGSRGSGGGGGGPGRVLWHLPTTRQGERLRHTLVVGRRALRRLEVGRGLLDVADLEIKEGETLQRPDMRRRDPQRHVPLVERALVVVLVSQHAGVQVVRIGEMRVALEAVQRDALRGIELPFAAQRFGEPQKHQTLRILGELGGERADLVSHD